MEGVEKDMMHLDLHIKTIENQNERRRRIHVDSHSK